MNAAERANELYWGSSQSVNHIADALDLSKGALYEMIRPQPTGLGCPRCNTEVVHSNRTAKERARVDCPECGWDGTEADTVEHVATGASDREHRSPAAPRIDGVEPVDEIYPVGDFDAPRPPPASVGEPDRDLGRLVAGGALLGAAVGLAFVLWTRRR